jgi:hypothetical protein
MAGESVAVDSSPNHFDGVYTQNIAGNSPVLGDPGLATNCITVNGGSTVELGRG